MGKGRKIWAIILIAFGGITFLSGFADIKETWPVFIVGLIPIAIGVLMLMKGMKQVRDAEATKQAEIERLAAIEKDIQERTRSFWFTVEDPNQEIVEKLYAEQYSEKNYPMPKCSIVPYADDDFNEYGFNVMIDDKKVGEVPRENGPEVIEAINNGEHTEIYFLSNREMAKDGYVYSLTITVKYLKK